MKSYNYFYPFLILFFLTIFFLLTLGFSQYSSVTIDEFGHVPAGYYYIKTLNPKFLALNPPLIQMFSVFPLLFTKYKIEVSTNYDNYEFWHIGYNFFINNFKIYTKIYLISRISIIFLAIILGIFIFLWGKILFDKETGIIALLLYLFHPTVLAHSGLATTDIGVSLTFFPLYFYIL